MAQEPIVITGIWLRSEGRDRIVLEVELPGVDDASPRRWVRLLSEHVADVGGVISHIVEPNGIRVRVEAAGKVA
jgi:hypothetical protein